MLKSSPSSWFLSSLLFFFFHFLFFFNLIHRCKHLTREWDFAAKCSKKKQFMASVCCWGGRGGGRGGSVFSFLLFFWSARQTRLELCLPAAWRRQMGATTRQDVHTVGSPLAPPPYVPLNFDFFFFFDWQLTWKPNCLFWIKNRIKT